MENFVDEIYQKSHRSHHGKLLSAKCHSTHSSIDASIIQGEQGFHEFHFADSWWSHKGQATGRQSSVPKTGCFFFPFKMLWHLMFFIDQENLLTSTCPQSTNRDFAKILRIASEQNVPITNAMSRVKSALKWNFRNHAKVCGFLIGPHLVFVAPTYSPWNYHSAWK